MYIHICIFARKSLAGFNSINNFAETATLSNTIVQYLPNKSIRGQNDPQNLGHKKTLNVQTIIAQTNTNRHCMPMYFFGSRFRSLGVSGVPYHFRVTSCRTPVSKFCTGKIKKYGQCCQICFENYSLN